ncbi:HK97 family phage prohead protease [Actinoallomurus oryzae]|uniref:HK97 family phage prohead protease n=1 Tax=Actinoallomurus oryzae TaxID=502180 RepID=A0ABP8R597_9ACTN
MLYRTAHVRADQNGRTIFGLAVPYGVVSEVNDGYGPYREQFAPGAFTRSIRERGHKVKLFVQHATERLPIGRAVELDERADGLHAAFSVARTRDGDEALELVAAGVVDGFSVGFASLRDRKEADKTVTRVEASLREVSLVHSPAYPDALVGGVRSASTTPYLTVARARLELLEATLHTED